MEFLPVRWHSALHSESTGINNRLKRVTLRSIPKMRSYTNETLTDILFYTSPKYCQHIIDTVAATIKHLRQLFLQRNPDFRVSFYCNNSSRRYLGLKFLGYWANEWGEGGLMQLNWVPGCIQLYSFFSNGLNPKSQGR